MNDLPVRCARHFAQGGMAMSGQVHGGRSGDRGRRESPASQYGDQQANQQPGASATPKLKYDIDDPRYWQDLANRLKEIEFLSPMQYKMILAMLKGFGKAWTPDAIELAHGAMVRLNHTPEPRRTEKAKYFVIQVQTALPELKDRIDAGVRVALVVAPPELVARVETIVYIYFAARDKPELLNHL